MDRPYTVPAVSVSALLESFQKLTINIFGVYLALYSAYRKFIGTTFCTIEQYVLLCAKILIYDLSFLEKFIFL